jgi:hypothetical protein
MKLVNSFFSHKSLVPTTIVLLPFLHGAFYPIKPALAQNIGIGGYQFLAADCATVVTDTQNQSLTISANNGHTMAKCTGRLDTSVNSNDTSLSKAERVVRCDFANSGLPCTIAASPVQNLSPMRDETCQTTCAVTLQDNSAEVVQENAAVLAQDNGNSQTQPTANATQTDEWHETIRPNGRVLLTCESQNDN